jgi:hypothetical protein
MKLKWVTRNGKEIAIKKMDDQHIHNCMRILANKVKNGTDDEMDTIYLKAFKKELREREYQLLLSRVAALEVYLPYQKIEEAKGVCEE